MLVYGIGAEHVLKRRFVIKVVGYSSLCVNIMYNIYMYNI